MRSCLLAFLPVVNLTLSRAVVIAMWIDLPLVNVLSRSVVIPAVTLVKHPKVKRRPYCVVLFDEVEKARGKRLHTRHHKSGIPLENATDNPRWFLRCRFLVCNILLPRRTSRSGRCCCRSSTTAASRMPRLRNILGIMLSTLWLLRIMYYVPGHIIRLCSR